MIDRFGVTVANSIFHKEWLYFINKKAIAKVYQGDVSTLSEVRKQVSNTSVSFIKAAKVIAIYARTVFDECKPCFPKDHCHWREVRTARLASKITDTHCELKLKLSEGEFDALVMRLNWAKKRMECMSYNRLCLFIGEAVHGRFKNRGRLSDSEVVNPYLT